MAPQRVNDPTLIRPWAKLAEGDVEYYWNEETGKTQYERPTQHERPTMPTSSQPSSSQVLISPGLSDIDTYKSIRAGARALHPLRARWTPLHHFFCTTSTNHPNRHRSPPAIPTDTNSTAAALHAWRAHFLQRNTDASITCRCRATLPPSRFSCLSRPPLAATSWMRY